MSTHALWPWKEFANTTLRPERRIELSVRQETRLQATEERLQMSTLWEMYGRSLHTILTHQNYSATSVTATILMTMHIDNFIHIDIERIAPIETLVSAIGVVVTVHQLIRCPLDGQRLNTLMQTQITRHGFSHILGQHKHVVLAIEQRGT